MSKPVEWDNVHELFLGQFTQNGLLELTDGHPMSYYCVVEKLHRLHHTHNQWISLWDAYMQWLFRHDLAPSWLFRPLELCNINLLTYLIIHTGIHLKCGICLYVNIFKTYLNFIEIENGWFNAGMKSRSRSLNLETLFWNTSVSSRENLGRSQSWSCIEQKTKCLGLGP